MWLAQESQHPSPKPDALILNGTPFLPYLQRQIISTLSLEFTMSHAGAIVMVCKVPGIFHVFNQYHSNWNFKSFLHRSSVQALLFKPSNRSSKSWESWFYNWIIQVAGVLESKGNCVKINSSICIEHKLHKSASLNIYSLLCSLHMNELSTLALELWNSGDKRGL